MEDQQIIDLYFARDEQAIWQTERKYGSYCLQIAQRILCNREDSQECLSDTFLRTWRAIPPTRPGNFRGFLGKLTRHQALDAWRRNHSAKRGGGEVPLVLEELEECIAGSSDPQREIERREFTKALNRFLADLPLQERKLFVCRYWHLYSVADLAEKSGLTQSNVKTTLFRTRKKLHAFLTKEGVL